MAIKTRDDKVSDQTPGYDKQPSYDPVAQNDSEASASDSTYDDNYSTSGGASREDRSTRPAASRLADNESNPSADWENNVTKGTGGPAGAPKAKGMKAYTKKFGPFGIVIGLVIGGGGIAMFFGPASMILHITHSLKQNNSHAESSFQHRAMKVLGVKMAGQSELCDAKRVKCRMGQMSTKGFKRLEAKGVVAYDADGNRLSTAKGRYANKPVATYRVDGGSPIPANQIRSHIASDHRLASKIYGRAGAFPFRFYSWTGKHMKLNMFDRWNVKRNGGIADGSNNRNTTTRDTLNKAQRTIPSTESTRTQASNNVSSKGGRLVSLGKKGGLGYLAAVGVCASSKLPSIITFGVAAAQAARLLPLVSNVVLSPSSKFQSSHYTDPSGYDLSAVGDTLTATDKNGRAATDSVILQSAMGVNTGKVGPSPKFTPGYALLMSPEMQDLRQAEATLEPSCNLILSREAMYGAAGVSTATTVLASATIILGVLKVVGEVAASYAIMELFSVIGKAATNKAIDKLAESDALDRVLSEGAVGEELGDALGMSSMLFFSAQGAARNTPILSVDELPAYEETRTAQLENERQMDIATLSPFDISSQHTWLGSIVHDMNNFALINGGYSGAAYLRSAASFVASAPSRVLSGDVLASDLPSREYCDNADALSMGGNGDNNPAINAAGYPCYGYFGNLSTEAAIAIAEGNNSNNEKWLTDEAIEGSSEDYEATLSDIARKESRLYDYINDCGTEALLNGDYAHTATGCTLGIETATEPSELTICSETVTENCVEVDPEEDFIIDNKSSSQIESEALAAFALDYQVSQAIDGNDPDDGSYTGSPAVPPNSSPELPDGTNQELAQKIVEGGNVSGWRTAYNQIEAYAETGRPRVVNGRECHVNPTIMKMIYELSTQYNLYLTSINRYCIDASGVGAGTGSFHYKDGGGHALDIGIVDGVVSTGATSKDIELIQYIAGKIPPGSQVGQSQCREAAGVPITLPIEQFPDICHHIHFNVPVEMAD